MKADFSGYATRANVRCSDGLTIMPDAFKHNSGKKVPLVWQHGHDNPENVLGHMLLENRPDGVYAYGFFNDSAQALAAKSAVQHKDITALSIFANKLKKVGANVKHGEIREVSLVLAGANLEAFIDTVAIQHGDGEYHVVDDEFIYYSGTELEHSDTFDVEEISDTDDVEDETVDEVSHDVETDETEVGHMATDETVQDVYETLTPKQKEVVNFMLGAALDEGKSLKQSDENEDDESANASEDLDNDNTAKHGQEGNEDMTRNAFEQNESLGGKAPAGATLSHSEIQSIFQDAIQGGSLRGAVEKAELKHGIDNIEVLFPDAKNVMQTPEFLARRTEWVATVMDGTHHTPFSRIKSMIADLTFDAARAKGYVKGNLKQEEFFAVSKRETTPQTIYKKQKLDRDDILDITDFDVVAWLKGEMRLMLEEEVARAILIGDGRSLGDIDKIKEANIRPIATDHEVYVTTVYVNLEDASSSDDELIDAMTKHRHHYRGSGSPVFFTSETVLARLLLIKDTLGRRIYSDVAAVASAMRVKSIIPVEVMEEDTELLGIMVDLRDYNVGTDKGGNVSLFDDFDIDYNQYKYLIETRLSGALVKAKSAIVVRQTAAGAVLVAPTEPVFDPEANTITVPTITGVTWTATDKDGASVTITAGVATVTAVNSPVTVLASPTSSSYYFATDAHDEWTYVYVP